MYADNFKFKQKNGINITIKKRISNKCYIVEMKLLDPKNKIIKKGFKIAEDFEIKERKLDFFVDINTKRK